MKRRDFIKGASALILASSLPENLEALTLGQRAVLLGGSVGPNLSAYLFYDSFPGPVISLDGRAAQKGGNHQASGAAGSGMTAGDGIMKQAAAAGTAGYDITPDLGQIPGKVVGEWQMVSGDFTYPATIGIAVDATLSPMLHGEGTSTNFFIRLVNAGPTFIVPLFVTSDANWSLSLATTYRDELHYNGGKMAAMVKRAVDGTILGRQLIYDFRLPSYVGNYAFRQTLTDKINYSLVSDEATSDYSFPAVTEVWGLANPTTTNVVATVFGGTTTNSGAGIVIAGSGYGQGGQIDLGAVTIGDKFRVDFDAASFSGGQMEVALLKNGAFEVEKSNAVYFTSDGRISAALTATETMAGASVAIMMGPELSGAGGCTVTNLQILKTPPTTP